MAYYFLIANTGVFSGCPLCQTALGNDAQVLQQTWTNDWNYTQTFLSVQQQDIVLQVLQANINSAYSQLGTTPGATQLDIMTAKRSALVNKEQVYNSTLDTVLLKVDFHIVSMYTCVSEHFNLLTKWYSLQ